MSHIPSLAEIKRAAFSLLALKSPGSDGYLCLFYQRHWSTIESFLVSFVQKTFLQGEINPEINYTFLALIPKTNPPSNPRLFCPISLCNSVYKIISKILVSSIRPALNSLISSYQNSFLPKRGTEVNYLIASEILHSMRVKKGRKSFFSLKIYLKKAYDGIK